MFKLFKQRSHYVFDYKPRYYDERKERIKSLEKKYGKEDADDGYEISFSKDNLKAQWQRNRRKTSNRNVNIRLAIIIAILVGIVAYVFKIHTLF